MKFLLADRMLCCMDKELAVSCGLSVMEFNVDGYVVSTDPKWDHLHNEVSDSESAGPISYEDMMRNFPVASEAEVINTNRLSVFIPCFLPQRVICNFATSQLFP